MNSEIRRPVLVWDIDGTLLQARGLGRQALNRAFLQLFGIDNAFDGLDFAGATDHYLLTQAFQTYALSLEPDATALFFRGYVRELQGLLAQSPLEPLAGVAALIPRLSQAGWPMVLGTGNIRGGAYCKLSAAGLANYFPSGGFSAAHLDRPGLLTEAIKPFPDNALAIVIGDTPRDIDAAHAIGLPALCVATGRYEAADLDSKGADWVLDDLTDGALLLRVINEIHLKWPKAQGINPEPMRRP